MTITATAEAHTGRLPRTVTVSGKTANGTLVTLPVTQHSAEEFIRIDDVTVNGSAVSLFHGIYELNVNAKDTTEININFTSNSDAVSMVVHDNLIPDERLASMCSFELYDSVTGDKITWTNSDGKIPDDPGAAREQRYKLRIYGFKENKTESPINIGTLALANSIVGGTVVTDDAQFMIVQKAGVKTYAAPEFSFTYSKISAAGTTYSEAGFRAITATQTWGWNNNLTNGGTIDLTQDSAAAVFNYSFSDDPAPLSGMTIGEDGKISGVPSLRTTLKEETQIATVTGTVTANGKTSKAVTAPVYQVANEVTYGDPEFHTATDSPVNFSSAMYGLNLFSDILRAVDQLATYTSNAEVRNEFDYNEDIANGNITVVETKAVDGFSLSKAANNYNIQVTENYSSTARNGYEITITAKKNGKTASIKYVFNQAAGGSNLSFNPATLTFPASGGTLTFSVVSNDTWTLS